MRNRIMKFITSDGELREAILKPNWNELKETVIQQRIR